MAITVLHNIFKKHKKTMFVQAPPGKGKSRMIGSIVFGATSDQSSIDKIVVVFPSEILKKTDEEFFA